MNSDEREGVIPLSRFRAALARARRGRRAEAILSEPEAEKLVPRLPVQELYYAIKEVGLEEARDLVALASPEQMRGFLDLDAWEKDRLDETKLREWIDAVVDVGPQKVKAVFERLDPEVVALYIQRHAKVYDLTLTEALPDEPEGHFYPTPDRFFLLDVLMPGEAGKAFERAIDWLYRADLDFARHAVMSARWEMPSDLEEHAYRWRTGRMGDLGYVEYYEALSIYRPLDPSSVSLDESSAQNVAPPEPGQTLPTQLATVLNEGSFFARALGTIGDEAGIDRLQALLMLLVNKAMAADLVEAGDIERGRQTLERVVGYLDIGLEYLSRSDMHRAGLALKQVALERIFRVGFTMTTQLRKLADALAGPKGAGAALLDAPYDALVRELRQLRPTFQGRPFRTLADIRQAASMLEEAARVGPFFFGALGITPHDLAEAVRASTARAGEVTYGALVRTWAGNVLLHRPPSVKPLHPRDLRALGRLEDADRATLDGALGRPSSPLEKQWMDEWLREFPNQILVRYSWLK